MRRRWSLEYWGSKLFRKKKSIVSVIVPIYNMESYIGKCLDSLVNQTLDDLEVICVNYGSTDNSLGVIKQFRKKDRRIRIINRRNKGRSFAREIGIKKARSPYIMFCDADDRFMPTMCEKMVSAIKKENTDLAVCGMKIKYEVHKEMKESDDNYYKIRFKGKKDIDDNIILGTSGSVCNKIFRRNIIRDNEINFPEGLNTAEDHYFYCTYMSVSKTICFVNQKLYEYVRRDGSTMSINFERNKLSLDDLIVARKIFDFYEKTGFLNEHKNLFWIQWLGAFWASYGYSDENGSEIVLRVGKDFIDEYYDVYSPSDSTVIASIQEVKDKAAKINK